MEFARKAASTLLAPTNAHALQSSASSATTKHAKPMAMIRCLFTQLRSASRQFIFTRGRRMSWRRRGKRSVWLTMASTSFGRKCQMAEKRLWGSRRVSRRRSFWRPAWSSLRISPLIGLPGTFTSPMPRKITSRCATTTAIIARNLFILMLWKILAGLFCIPQNHWCSGPTGVTIRISVLLSWMGNIRGFLSMTFTGLMASHWIGQTAESTGSTPSCKSSKAQKSLGKIVALCCKTWCNIHTALLCLRIVSIGATGKLQALNHAISSLARTMRRWCKANQFSVSFGCENLVFNSMLMIFISQTFTFTTKW